MAVDSASWHLHDATTWERAATHIALFWAHLVEAGHLTPAAREADGLEGTLDRTRTPSELRGELSDDRLVAEDFDPAAQPVLAKTSDYLGDLGYELDRHPAIRPNYNIVDTWDNVAWAERRQRGD